MTTAIQTKFKKGDVVQFKGDTYGSSKGLRAIVLLATPTSVIIERKGKFINCWFDVSEFELAPKHEQLQEAKVNPEFHTLLDKIVRIPLFILAKIL